MTPDDSWLRRTILGIGLLGALAFGGAWITSWVDPLFVESVARDLVRAEVQERVETQLDRLDGTALAGLASRLSARNSATIADLERQVAAGVPQQVAAIAAQMLDADCACRRRIEARIRQSFADRIGDLGQLNTRLADLIRAKYQDVAAALTREFRIFTGANALLFGLLAGIAAIRRRAGLQMVVPALVLLVAAAVVGASYLFAQDWLRTILFGDYVGLAYFAYLGVVVVFLADIALNRARVTSVLLNTLFQLVGSAFHAVPC
jgi:uncharacterized membrane protein (GlpM family)